jgi:hypothetical protein
MTPGTEVSKFKLHRDQESSVIIPAPPGLSSFARRTAEGGCPHMGTLRNPKTAPVA